MQQDNQPKHSSTLEVDLNTASAFLSFIAEEGPITFQYYRDRKEKGQGLAGHFTASLEDAAQRLTRLNLKDECGIFFMVNEGDGNGRKSENVVRVRALFLDLDGAPLEPVLRAPLSPHAIVNSSPGRYQVYWLIEDCPIDRFRGLQVSLAQKFDGDRSIHEPCRVMRLPGFYHQKKEGEPFRVQIIDLDYKPPYPLRVFLQAMAFEVSEREALQIVKGPLPELPVLFEKKLSYGERHQTLLRYSVKFAFQGLSAQEVYDKLQAINHGACIEPKPDKEIEDLATSAVRFVKDKEKQNASFFFDDGQDLIAQAELMALEEEERRRAAMPEFNPKSATSTALAYLAAHPNRTLASQGQIYRYKEQEHRWIEVADTDMDGVVQSAIERLNPEMFLKLKMSFLADVRKAIKYKLQGENHDRIMEADRWRDGRPGQFVSLANGILDIEKGELHPHTPEYFSFTTLEFNYDPSASCPLFLRFLEDIWDDDQELKRSLQLWFGYLLLGTTDFQKFAVLKGLSRGGKGTMANIMAMLVGRSNVTGGEVATFCDSFGMEQLIGKRLAIFPEIDKTRSDHLNIFVERIKAITGQDIISINRKNKPYLNTRLPVKFVVTCNDLPQFHNAKSSFTNRMIVFPFTKTFEGKIDPHLLAKLSKELPGIFNWALQGARDIISGEKLESSPTGKKHLKMIEIQLSQVLNFIKEHVELTGSPVDHMYNDMVWQKYLDWSRDNHRGTMGNHKFMLELVSNLKTMAQEQGKPLKKDRSSKGRYYIGVRLLEEPLDLPDDVDEQAIIDDSDIPF